MQKTIGKNTLGSGKKMKVDLRSYERSTHDRSFIFRSTMAPGTLVPFLVDMGLTGDTWDINLEASVLTHPTIGPLFGSFKVQLDVFTADVRLYQGKLHNNAINIGLKMETIKLPQILMEANDIDLTKDPDNQQINPSCILKYLGIGGIGHRIGGTGLVDREFNAIHYLAYGDIYKNYYANKQEEVGAVIHNTDVIKTITVVTVQDASGNEIVNEYYSGLAPANWSMTPDSNITFEYTGTAPEPEDLLVTMGNGQNYAITDMFDKIEFKTVPVLFIQASEPREQFIGTLLKWWLYAIPEENRKPQIVYFPLENIDGMREDILSQASNPNAFTISDATDSPYGLPLQKTGDVYSKTTPLEGLYLKTYQSDIFNNWISTEWLDGVNGINAITAIDTSAGEFTIDTLTLKRKIYNMLNAIAISGGTYDDWLDVNWDEERHAKPETPEYHGGLSKELIFQEVVSNSASSSEGDQPLGTLAGRGVLSKKHKGGYVRIKPKEPTAIMGIVSITPRIDYSQGNEWFVNLKTMDDFHKPALDQIGFQDLITDQMAWWDTGNNGSGVSTFRSVGKQPAWINYMTNYNKVFGNFAIESEQMFMVLNRRYEFDKSAKDIKDLTTYIDPAKFNHIFAYTKRDAQNFWVQIGINMEVRRKMSAKIMPVG